MISDTLNDSTKIFPNLEQTTSKINKKLNQLTDDFAGVVKAVSDQIDVQRNNFVDAKFENIIANIADTSFNAKNSRIKEASVSGQAQSVSDVLKWGEYGQGGFRMMTQSTKVPMTLMPNTISNAVWVQMDYPDSSYLYRELASNALNVDGGYTLSTPSAEILNTLQTNSNLDKLGSTFGRVDLSVYSPDAALAFNCVSTKFSMTQIFLKTLLYQMQGDELTKNKKTHEIITDTFPTVTMTDIETHPTCGIIPTIDGYAGYTTNKWHPRMAWCTIGQFVNLRRGKLDVVANSYAADYSKGADDYALIPIDATRLATAPGQITDLYYVLSHLEYPFVARRETGTWLNEPFGTTNALSLKNQTNVLNLSNNIHIDGHTKILFVLMNTYQTVPNQALNIDFGTGNINVDHWSAAAAFVPAADIQNMQAGWRYAKTAIADLLKIYGCSEGLEEALKILPCLTYGFGVCGQLQVNNTNLVPGIDLYKYWGTSNLVDKTAGGDLRRFASTIVDCFGRGWGQQQDYVTVGDYVFNRAPPVYNLPAYQSLQSLALATKVFTNSSSKWKYNVYNNSTNLEALYKQFWFSNDFDKYLEMLFSYVGKAALAAGVCTSLIGRALGVHCGCIWNPIDEASADMGWAGSNMIASTFYREGFVTRSFPTNIAFWDITYLNPSWNNNRYKVFAWNVSVSNIWGLDLDLSEMTSTVKRFRETHSNAVRIRSTGHTFVLLRDNVKMSLLNLLSQHKIKLLWSLIGTSQYDPLVAFNSNLADDSSGFGDTVAMIDVSDLTAADYNEYFLPMRWQRQLWRRQYGKNEETITYTSVTSNAELIMPFFNNFGRGFTDAGDDIFCGLAMTAGYSTAGYEFAEATDDSLGVVFTPNFSNVGKTANSLLQSFRKIEPKSETSSSTSEPKQ